MTDPKCQHGQEAMATDDGLPSPNNLEFTFSGFFGVIRFSTIGGKHAKDTVTNENKSKKDDEEQRTNPRSNEE